MVTHHQTDTWLNHHLVLIWSNSLKGEAEILEALSNQFDIISETLVTWPKDTFAKNLSRFYLGKKILVLNKIAVCGDGQFKIFIIEDKCSNYTVCDTNSGPQLINKNVLELKNTLRASPKTAAIHITNNTKELLRDLDLINIFPLLKGQSHLNNPMFRGSKTWNSFHELFNTLDKNINYVVLRNFETVANPVVMNQGEHPDVDLLVDDVQRAASILNGTPNFKWYQKNRVCFEVNVGRTKVNFDLRSPKDGYYCEKWANDILSTRQHQEFFYVPSEEQLTFSLLYHALVHKHQIANDYIEIFAEDITKGRVLLTDTFFDHLSDTLCRYMKRNGYRFTIPKDRSVYFNESYFRKLNNDQLLKKVRRILGPRRLIKKGLSNARLLYPMIKLLRKQPAK